MQPLANTKLLRIVNIHKRVIDQPIAVIASLFETLSSSNDSMLATDKWPAMFLDKGLKVGSKGGHGIIRYSVIKYQPGECIRFRFSRPIGFDGDHEFKISALGAHQTELRHEINMRLRGQAYLTWPLVIRWLHDAYIEDAFDRVENTFNIQKKTASWSLWVRILRAAFTLVHKKTP